MKVNTRVQKYGITTVADDLRHAARSRASKLYSQPNCEQAAIAADAFAAKLHKITQEFQAEMCKIEGSRLRSN